MTLTVILVVLPPWCLSFSGKAQESKITPRTWVSSEEGTKYPKPSTGTTLPSYSKFTTPTVVVWILLSSSARGFQSNGTMFARHCAGIQLITWSTVIWSFTECTVSFPSEVMFKDVQGAFILTLTPCCLSMSCNLSVTVCMPPSIDHVLQCSFLAIVARGLRTEVSGAMSAREIS